jgi:hypothetical protein
LGSVVRITCALAVRVVLEANRQNDREKRLRERKQKARPERLSFIWIRLANGMASLRLAEGAQSW